MLDAARIFYLDSRFFLIHTCEDGVYTLFYLFPSLKESLILSLFKLFSRISFKYL